MTALYFAVLRPEDRVAVKPHASPVFHAIQYLLGNQTREKLEDFRGFKRRAILSLAHQGHRRRRFLDRLGRPRRRDRRSSPAWSRTIVQRAWLGQDRPEGRMIALVGDAEIDEGNIFECLLEGWKQGLRNCWWIIDYNRQSLDAVVREGLYERIEALFERVRLGRRHPQIRLAARGGLRRARRREAARLDRPLPEPALFGADLPGRRGLAEAPPRRSRRPGSGDAR